jgi:hypothetical protein
MTNTKDLPELPEPLLVGKYIVGGGWVSGITGYTADQMQAYARAAQVMPCRMLTPEEVRGCFEPEDSEYGNACAVIRKFAKENGLTLRVEP